MIIINRIRNNKKSQSIFLLISNIIVGAVNGTKSGFQTEFMKKEISRGSRNNSKYSKSSHFWLITQASHMMESPWTSLANTNHAN